MSDAPRDPWPELPLAAWRPTCDTLHMLAQIVGKIRLALAPPEPQWAQVALYVTPLGLTTGPIPYRDRAFQIDFDLLGHALRIVTSEGATQAIPLRAQSVAESYAAIHAALRALTIDATIWPMPVEVPDPIRFDRDTVHAAYDPEYAARFARVLVSVDAALGAHRAPFRGRHTRVQFFFGTFDLAYARFSGRPATPPSDDPIARGAMDAQEICAGFWPGDARYPEPAFWCYAYPKPEGAETLAVLPAAASWNAAMGEFLLPYAAVRAAAEPRALLAQFFGSTFEALARAARWSEVASS